MWMQRFLSGFSDSCHAIVVCGAGQVLFVLRPNRARDLHDGKEAQMIDVSFSNSRRMLVPSRTQKNWVIGAVVTAAILAIGYLTLTGT
jgi:hypothetical protein